VIILKVSVEALLPMGVSTHAIDPLPANLIGGHQPKPVQQSRTVSLQMSMPLSNSGSSRLRNNSGWRTYIITASRGRMIYGELSK
jgi:hypothetical protein